MNFSSRLLRCDRMEGQSWSIPRLAVKAASLISLLVGIGMATPAQADPYHLGTLDKVRLRVSEWQTAEGSFRDWSSVSGEYTVGPEGTLSVPFVGDIDVKGKTTTDIGALVGNALQQRFGLSEQPDAVLEIAEFRPIYVSGDVQAPGAFPFAPGLTVMKAISIAGGARRLAEQGQRIERDIISARGDFNVLTAERLRLLARLARLDAEGGGGEIEMPPELKSNPQGPVFIAAEAVIMKANLDQIASQVAALDDLRELLRNEIQSLQKRRETQERQMKIARAELSSVGSLANRGLVVNARVSDLERAVADLEGRMLDIDVASLRAKQEISRADRDTIKLENDHKSAIATERQTAAQQLKAAELKIQTQEGLIREALLITPDAAIDDKVQYSYTLVRATADGVSVTLQGEENTLLEPGDLVRVKRILPASLY